MNRWGLPIGILAVLLATVGWLQHWQGQSRAGFTAPDFALPQFRLSAEPPNIRLTRSETAWPAVWARLTAGS